MMDKELEEILTQNQDRVRYAEEVAQKEEETKKAYAAEEKAHDLWLKRREAAIQGHWLSGVGTGVFGVLSAGCIVNDNALLAVSCVLSAAFCLIAGNALLKPVLGSK